MKHKLLALALSAVCCIGIMPKSKVSAVETPVCDWNFGYARVQTDRAAEAYRVIAERLRKLDFDITFRKSDGFTYDDIQQAVLTFFQNDPELFYIGSDLIAQECGDGSVFLEMKLVLPGIAEPQPVTPENTAYLAECAQALNETADAIRADMPAGADTDYAKALWLHDYVSTHVRYAFSYADGQHTWDDQTAYGALVKGEAICSGYANAYTLLLRRAGLPAVTVHGYGYGEGHAWVLHWIDGECVYSDPTWEQCFGMPANHQWFGMTLAEISDTHTLSDSFARDVPPCSHASHRYISQGDLNANGEITVADAVLLIRLLTEDSGEMWTQIAAENADIDNDSTVTAADVRKLLAMLAAGAEPALASWLREPFGSFAQDA